MGGGSWTRNKRINDAVATKASLRPSPSAVQGKNVSQVTEPPKYTGTPYQGIVSQEYSSGSTYGSPEEALANFNTFIEGIQEDVQKTTSKYNYMNYDPGDFARAGYSGPTGLASAASSDAASEYILKNKIPPSIEVDGQTLYLTTGLGEDTLAKTLGDDYTASGSYEALGPVGTYSTIYKKPESIFSSINPVLRAALGVATGGASEAFISTAKAISGETLHAGDYLNLAVQGYKIANAPPTTATTTGATPPRSVDEIIASGDAVSATSTSAEIADEIADIWGTTVPESPFTFDFDGIPVSIVGGGVGGYQGYDDAGREEEVLLPTGYTPETFRDEPEVDPVLEAIEDIVADPFEEDIPTPTLPPVTEEPEPEEQEQTSGGGGGGGGQEEGAPSQGTGAEEVIISEGQETGEGSELIVLEQIYEAAINEENADLKESLIEEYIRAGGRFVDELRANTPYEEVYAPEEVIVEEEEPVELDETGEPITREEEVEDLFILDPWDEWDEGSDLTGGGDIGDIGGTDGTGTTGGGTGSVGDTGTGEGTGTGDGTGTGSGTGTGEGTGTGDGSGNGTGSGSGTGTGAGTGAGVGLGSATRTTDSLFGDMLQLETQVGDTQELLRPFSLAPTPSIMPYNEPQPQLLNQFLQQQQDMQLQYQPQRMLTDSRFPKGYNF